MCATVLHKFCKSVSINSSYCRYTIKIRRLNYISKEYSQDGKDPAPMFFDSNVQMLLKSLTRMNLDKVFKKRKTGDLQLEQPTYKFLTDKQLEEVLASAHSKAEEFLQMPPVIKVRKPIDRVLSKDSALQGLDTAKFVFTDISYGIKDLQRIIVVREPDGTLKEADWNLRDRMNQLYFPRNGRKIKMPHMFEDIYLESLLKRKEYEFVLDRACIQFEPDDKFYQRVTSIVYQCVNDNGDFEMLRSTRHFGPLAFFLTWFKNIDNLLLELIETFYIEDVNILLRLYERVHEQNFAAEKSQELEALASYIAKEAQKKGPLELAVQAYKDLKDRKSELEKGIQKAHGLA